MAPAGQEGLPSGGGQRRQNSIPTNGGDEGPVWGDKGGVPGHELSDPRDQARNHSGKGGVVAVVAATNRLPNCRQAEEAEPNPEGLSSRRRAPGPALIS
jgi:hypothetical protein